MRFALLVPTAYSQNLFPRISVLGAGYNYFDLHGHVSRSGFLGTLRMQVQGAEGFVRLVY